MISSNAQQTEIDIHRKAGAVWIDFLFRNSQTVFACREGIKNASENLLQWNLIFLSKLDFFSHFEYVRIFFYLERMGLTEAALIK